MRRFIPERALLAAFWALFVAYGAWGLAHHAMWRDELQAWSLASAAGSPGGLVANMHREASHPMLWHTLVFLAKGLWHDPRIMQVLNLVIVAAAAAAVAGSRLWTTTQKVLILCGYHFSFEYLLISRSYGLGLLLVVAFARWIEAHPDRLQSNVSALLLGALINTHLYGIFLALALAGHAVRTERRVRPMFAGIVAAALAIACATMRRPGILTSPKFAELLPALIGCAAAFALCVLAWRYRHRQRVVVMLGGALVAAAGAAVLRRPQSLASPALLNVWYVTTDFFQLAWAPIPDVRSSGHWGDLLYSVVPELVGPIVAAAGLAWAWLLLRRRTHPLVFIALTGSFVAFHAFVFTGTLRHVGTWWFGVIALDWIARARGGAKAGPGTRLSSTLFLAPQAIAGLLAAVYWSGAMFSPAEAAAAWIRRTAGTDGYALVGDPAPEASAVAGYLGRPMYFRAGAYESRFIDWTHERRPRPWPEVLSRLDAGQSVFFVLPRDGDPDLDAALQGRATTQAVFDAGLVEDESFRVLFLAPRSPAAVRQDPPGAAARRPAP